MNFLLKISFFLFCLISIGNSENETHPYSITLSESDAIAFAHYKKNFSNQLVLDTTITTIPDSSFQLEVAGTARSYSCGNHCADCIYYNGNLPSIDSYVLTHCQPEYCETMLLNKTTGVSENLPSGFDNEAEVPVMSKNGSQMLVYASNVFEREAVISVYQKKEPNTPIHWNAAAEFNTMLWKINEIVWIDELSFAIHAYQKQGGIAGDSLVGQQFYIGKLSIN